MKEPIQVTIQPPIELAPADERFILFLKKVQFPIVETEIISWYRQYVQLNDKRKDKVYENGVWVLIDREKTDGEIRTNALAWFDRCLGRVIRKAIIPNAAMKLLSPIREENII
jgi:hypothetical protein